MTRLRIVTINTGKGDGPYRRRLGWLAAELGRLAPDIVLLQEALATPGGELDTTAHLATELKLAPAFAPARRKPRAVEGVWHDTWSGLGVLSRIDAFRTGIVALPDHPDDGERIALLGRWDVDGVDLVIANVHLTHLRDRDDLRAEQFATVLSHPWLDVPGAVMLIGGDLNTRPTGLGWLRATAAPRQLTDAFEAGGGARDRVTIPVGRPDLPGTCVDYLLTIEPAVQTSLTLSGAAVVLDRPDPDGVYPSDHYGIMVDMELPIAEKSSKGARPVRPPHPRAAAS